MTEAAVSKASNENNNLRLQVITATPRQLESGVRLAESLARMRLSPTVEPSDVREGLRLMQVRVYGVSVVHVIMILHPKLVAHTGALQYAGGLRLMCRCES